MVNFKPLLQIVIHETNFITFTQALAELKLMEWIGEKMHDLIMQVNLDYRLTAAVVIIVWVSALASSFIDNIPYTTAMVKHHAPFIFIF